jgi:hypothetical protein
VKKFTPSGKEQHIAFKFYWEWSNAAKRHICEYGNFLYRGVIDKLPSPTDGTLSLKKQRFKVIKSNSAIKALYKAVLETAYSKKVRRTVYGKRSMFFDQKRID